MVRVLVSELGTGLGMGVGDRVAGSVWVGVASPRGGITRGENKFITRVIHDGDEYDERSNIHGKDIRENALARAS